MKKDYDLICVGMALVDSIIKGFDPKPVSASGYRLGKPERGRRGGERGHGRGQTRP